MTCVTDSTFPGPTLKVLATMSAGYDHIDVEELKARGIKFGNTPYVLSAAVAEVAVLLCLATARRLHEGRLKIETYVLIHHSILNEQEKTLLILKP